MNFLKLYGDTEGPLGLPMKDKQAKTLEQILKAVPQEDRQLIRLVTAKAPAELLVGERADVSWITTESVDRDCEVVVAKGMNDSQFANNPLVTMMHSYSQPPIGRSLWRKRAKDSVAGIKAKTQYPTKPDDWTGDCWPPDSAFALVKAGLMQGKSIGFIRLKSHGPSSSEIGQKPDLANVSRIIDEWLLLEYACTFLPTNQEALVQSVSKSGITLPDAWYKQLNFPHQPAGQWPDTEQPAPPSVIPFTPLREIEKYVQRAIAAHGDPRTIAAKAVQDAYDRARGKV
jgi:hypothetical protein